MSASRTVPSRTWWLVVACVISAAMLLRFYELPLKPLHHDEGVNTLFLTRLVRPPHTYQYDPANYHGPTLYYFGWLSTAVVGLNTAGIRGVTAVAGLMTVVLPLFLRRQIGAVGSVAASTLLAVSPGAVYFSRYFIHEMLLVCFTVAAVVAAALWSQHGRRAYLYCGAAAAGLMFATKETAVIAAVVLTGAWLGSGSVCELRYVIDDREAANLPGRRLRAALSRWASAFPPGPRSGCPCLILTVVAVFAAVNLLFYTSLFTHWQGARDALKSFAIWTKTGTSAHRHPVDAYLDWLAAMELPLLILGGAGILWALWRADSRFAVFSALWAVGIVMAYSVIPYKTPWLTLNMIAPLAMSGGYAFERLWQAPRVLVRWLPHAVAAAAVGIMTWQSTVLNFVRYDDNRYPYVYVHTSREVFALVRAVERIQEQNPGARIAVVSRAHFPLSWYLRNYSTRFPGQLKITNDPVIIASEDQTEALNASIGPHYERQGSYDLRPGVRLVLYVRRDVRRQPATDVGAYPPKD